MDPIGASEYLGLARLPQFLRRHRRPARAVGERRQPLGRGTVGQYPRSCPLRLSVAATRASGTEGSILSERWVEMATTPTDVAPHYGYCGGVTEPRAEFCRSAPESSFFALGSGGNVIWIAPEHDLVVVTRWLDSGQLDGFIKLVSARATEAETTMTGPAWPMGNRARPGRGAARRFDIVTAPIPILGSQLD